MTLADNPDDSKLEKEQLLEDAVRSIKNKKYQEAYDKLSQTVNENKGSLEDAEKKYRDGKILANALDPGIAMLLSEVVTEEAYKSESVDDSKRKLQDFAKDYLSEK